MGRIGLLFGSSDGNKGGAKINKKNASYIGWVK